MNTVNLIGRLTADPRMATAKNGKPYARYTLAVDRPGKDAGTDFIPCVAWGRSAEFAESFLRKGVRIAITGSIDAGIREKKNGSKEMLVCVRVQRHSFADGKRTETHDSDVPYDQPEIDEDSPF